MKRRMLSWLLALSLLLVSLLPVNVLATDVATEGDLPGVEPFEEEMDLTAEAAQEVLSWEEKADAVKLTEKWRDDLIAIAESQLGYTENADGTSLYGEWAGYAEDDVDWTAHFINWVAEKAGLTEEDFPRGEDFDDVRRTMRKYEALVYVTKYDYPSAGDLAVIRAEDGDKMIGVVKFISNGNAAVIHGDDNGQVTQKSYKVGTRAFEYFIDLNVLMERAGLETGKGGEVPVIPEGGVAAWTNTGAVYMRSEPTVESKRVTTVRKSGTRVLVTGGEMQQDGYIWYAVQYDGNSGFIRGDLLTLDKKELPTATPKPTPAPTPKPTPEVEKEPVKQPETTPEVPVVVADVKDGECSVCNIYGAVNHLPEGYSCFYEFMASFADAEALYEYLSKLTENEYASYRGGYRAHFNTGANLEEILCSCENQHGPNSVADVIANPPGKGHKPECPWGEKTTTVRAKLDENGEPVSYELLLMVKGEDGKYTEEVIATTVKLGVTEENPEGDGYNYIKHTETGLIVAYLWFDSANQPWIIPLKSGNAD